ITMTIPKPETRLVFESSPLRASRRTTTTRIRVIAAAAMAAWYPLPHTHLSQHDVVLCMFPADAQTFFDKVREYGKDIDAHAARALESRVQQQQEPTAGA